MKVAFLLNRFPVLSETFILNQVTGLIDRGVAVDIYVRGEAPEPKVHGDVMRYGLRAIHLFQDGMPDGDRPGCLRRTLSVSIRRRRQCPGLFSQCLRQFRYGHVRDALTRLYPVAAMLEGGPYDVVHAHYGINGRWAVRLRRDGAFASKIVTTFHDGFDLSAYLRKQGAGAYTGLFREGDLFLPISGAVRERLAALGCPENKLAVHRVGIDVARFDRQAARRSTSGKLRIASVARLAAMKGIEYGIHAVAELAEDYPELEYRIAGDGPLRPELEALIGKLHLHGRVRLLGWQEQSEIQALLHDTDILLAPSITDADGAQEGLPTVLMEALACCVPVVVTNYSGIPELVRDGQEGFLTPEKDVGRIAACLRRLADHPELRREMGNRGRARVEELHNIDRLNDRLVELYREVSGSRR